MKIAKYIIATLILVLVLSAALTSCASPKSIQDSEEKIAGYTLKNKKEIMQQKILHKKSRTVIVAP